MGGVESGHRRVRLRLACFGRLSVSKTINSKFGAPESIGINGEFNMKKLFYALIVMLVMSVTLSACGAKNAIADPADLVTITANIKDRGGNIEMTDDGSDPEPNPEYPMQSAYANVEKGTVVKILAEPEDGYRFFQWTANGSEYSTEPLITVTAEDDADFLAEFLPEGKDGKPVNLETVTTLGDLLALPDIGTALYDATYIYAFEQDGNAYRAICDVPEEISRAIFALDFDDPDYNKKENELLAPLPVKTIENLTEGMPTQEEAERHIGKTGQELLDDGWSVHFYNLEELNFRMNHGIYSYDVTFAGEIKDFDNFDENTDMGGLTVRAIVCNGIGDATYWETPEE